MYLDAASGRDKPRQWAGQTTAVSGTNHGGEKSLILVATGGGVTAAPSSSPHTVNKTANASATATLFTLPEWVLSIIGVGNIHVTGVGNIHVTGVGASTKN